MFLSIIPIAAFYVMNFFIFIAKLDKYVESKCSTTYILKFLSPFKVT